MRRLQCILFGFLGVIVALLLSFGILLLCLIGVSVMMRSGSDGEVGWDPVSLARQQPLVAGTLLLLFIGFLAFGFIRGYRFRARRVAGAPLA